MMLLGTYLTPYVSMQALDQQGISLDYVQIRSYQSTHVFLCVLKTPLHADSGAKLV